jgi:hypothetical protein
MKNSAFTAAFIILFLFANALAAQNGAGPKNNSYLAKSANGKYSYIKGTCRDTSSTIMITRNGEPVQPCRPSATGKTPAKPATIYHVIFHFDISPYDMLCNAADTMFLSFFNMNWINNYTALEAYMPEGFYDILVEFPDGIYRNQHVFTRDFHVNMDRDTTINSTSANRVVTLKGVDENNILLPDMMGSGDALQINFEFPDNFKLESYSMSFSGSYTDYIKISDVRPGIKIYFGETAMLKPDHYQRYEITYPVVMGITKDTVLSNSPSDYRDYTIIHHPTPASYEPYYLFGCGILANCLLGPKVCIVAAFGWNDYPSQPTDTLRILTSNVAVDTNKYLFCYELFHCEYNPKNASGMEKSIDNAFYYVTPGNELVLSASAKYPPVAGDYLVNNGAVAHLADNAPFNATHTYNDQFGYEIYVSPKIVGQGCERRWIDKAVSTYDIMKGSQLLYHDSIGLNIIYYYAASPGIYSVVMNDSNYQLCGKPGFSQTTLTFDVGAEDPDPPVLKTMQILKGNEIATNIIHGYSASVQFMAGDFPICGNKNVYHHLKEIHLYFRKFSELNWQELTILSHPASLDSVMGMPYTADLEPVLAQHPDSAWIDLKFEMIDSTGNSNVQTIHPAFLVRDAITGITPAEENLEVPVYPDPASDKIHLVTDNEIIEVTIFTLAGQPVMQSSGSKDIDISRLRSGLYLVKIKDQVTGRNTFAKFVKN